MKKLQSLKIAATVASAVFAVSAVAQTESSAASTPYASSGSLESLGQHLSDGTITTKVKAELLGAKDVKASHIHVKTRRGVVWLTGTVPSDADKTRAQELAQGVSGVQTVKNRLKVIEAGGSD